MRALCFNGSLYSSPRRTILPGPPRRGDEPFFVFRQRTSCCQAAGHRRSPLAPTHPPRTPKMSACVREYQTAGRTKQRPFTTQRKVGQGNAQKAESVRGKTPPLRRYPVWFPHPLKNSQILRPEKRATENQSRQKRKFLGMEACCANSFSTTKKPQPDVVFCDGSQRLHHDTPETSLQT